MPAEFFGDDHDGTSFEAAFGFHVNTFKRTRYRLADNLGRD